MFMNRGGHDIKTTKYGERFTFGIQKWRRERAPASSFQIAGIKAEIPKKNIKCIIIVQNKLLTFYLELKLQVRRMENISLTEIWRLLASCCTLVISTPIMGTY